MITRSYKTRLLRDAMTSAIPVPFDPKEVFGKTRAPVKVTVNGYSYRSTIAAMGGPPFIPLRKSHYQAAGIDGDGPVSVTLELDTEKRTVKPPADLVKALKAERGAWEKWQALSFTHQREHVEAIEDAKKPETRTRRIERAVSAAAAAKPATKKS